MSDEKTYNLNINVNFAGMERALGLLEQIKSQGDKMATNANTLLADMAQQSTQLDSIKTLIQGLVANQNNPQVLQQLVQGFAGNEQKILDAITLGTSSALLTVTPSPVALASVGATQQLTVVDSTGADVTATSTYSSSDNTKATVSTSGLVTEVASGSATVSVASGVSAGTVQVTTA
jgi:hypothetical protein